MHSGSDHTHTQQQKPGECFPILLTWLKEGAILAARGRNQKWKCWLWGVQETRCHEIYTTRHTKASPFQPLWSVRCTIPTFDVKQCSLRGSTFCFCLLLLSLAVTGAPDNISERGYTVWHIHTLLSYTLWAYNHQIRQQNIWSIDRFHLNLRACAVEWHTRFAGSGGRGCVSWLAHSCISRRQDGRKRLLLWLYITPVVERLNLVSVTIKATYHITARTREWPPQSVENEAFLSSSSLSPS